MCNPKIVNRARRPLFGPESIQKEIHIQLGQFGLLFAMAVALGPRSLPQGRATIRPAHLGFSRMSRSVPFQSLGPLTLARVQLPRASVCRYADVLSAKYVSEKNSSRIRGGVCLMIRISCPSRPLIGWRSLQLNEFGCMRVAQK